jgi:large subunit ribosomal protein L22
VIATTGPEVRAVLRFARLSPHKVRRVLDQIRGRTYREALMILEFMPYRPCAAVMKLLRSAAANAEHNNGLDRSKLVITRATADGGPLLKRYQPRARGQAYRIHKPTCHITIAVRERADAEGQ